MAAPGLQLSGGDSCAEGARFCEDTEACRKWVPSPPLHVCSRKKQQPRREGQAVN